MKIVIIFAVKYKTVYYEEGIIFSYCPDGGYDRIGSIYLLYMAQHATCCGN